MRPASNIFGGKKVPEKMKMDQAMHVCTWKGTNEGVTRWKALDELTIRQTCHDAMDGRSREQKEDEGCQCIILLSTC